MKKLSAILALAFALTAPNLTAAHSLSVTECSEGGEFIRHAEMSRDAGITKEFFMSRFAEDVALIQSVPPDLRWFVQDEADERLLARAAARVFDQPTTPEQHEAAFIRECLETTTALKDAQ